MTLQQLEAMDTDTKHAVLIAGNLDWLPDNEPATITLWYCPRCSEEFESKPEMIAHLRTCRHK